jgi:hypothetical protein
VPRKLFRLRRKPQMALSFGTHSDFECEIETPEGQGFIGTQVHYVTTSQNAQITDGDDDEDEDEVTSSISFYFKD